MTPTLILVKWQKTIYDGHLAERRNTALFSLNFLIPTTCHSKK